MTIVSRASLDHTQDISSGSPVTGRAAQSSRFARRARQSRAASRICAGVLVLADVWALVLSVGVASLHHGVFDTEPVISEEQASVVVLLSRVLLMLGLLLVFARQGHYTRRLPFWTELPQIVVSTLVVMVCYGFLSFAIHDTESRLFLGLTWVVLPLFVVLGRTGARWLLTRAGVWRLPVVLVGRGPHARAAEAALRSEGRLGYDIVATACPTQLGATAQPDQWHELLDHYGAALLVISLDFADPAAAMLTESLVRARVPFAAMPRLGALPVLGVERTSFFTHDTVMLQYRNNLARPVARAMKMAFDLAAASALLLLALPVLLVLGALVRMDGGPALYAHRRIGANGRMFDCLKFRSMVVDADAVLHRLLENDAAAAAEWADTHKLRNDPRITRMGRFLRATSLDELPQLLNVLRLEMSLVGPRPIVRAEVNQYGEDIVYYYETRPGLTGLWQVSGRSDTSYAHRVHLDTWYAKNWTVWHDIAILAKTVPAVLKREGAV